MAWWLPSGQQLLGSWPGAEHHRVMLDDELREDVDGGQGAERHRAVVGPNQVDAKHTGQVGRAHLVDDALLRNLEVEGKPKERRMTTVTRQTISVQCCQSYWIITVIWKRGTFSELPRFIPFREPWLDLPRRLLYSYYLLECLRKSMLYNTSPRKRHTEAPPHQLPIWLPAYRIAADCIVSHYPLFFLIKTACHGD